MFIMRLIRFFLTFYFLLLTFTSCSEREKVILKVAGKNKNEIQKIITNYNNSDQLRKTSALFLLSNMPFHYSYSDSLSSIYDSIFMQATMQADNHKNTYLDNNMPQFENIEKKCDISFISYKYLSQMINFACHAWEKSPWNKYYPIEIFYDYVLPYKIGSETPSLWHNEILRIFPDLNDSTVLSRRGIEYKSEEAESSNCRTVNVIGSSSKYCTMMTNSNSTLTFFINENRTSLKRLIIKYSSSKPNLSATIKVNKNIIDTICLPQSRNLESLNEKWFDIQLVVDSGKNTISISDVSDTLVVDYIQLASIESFNRNRQIDFSKFKYKIINKKNNKCIVFNDDTIGNKKIWLESNNNPSQLLCLDYLGYPLWRISPDNKKSKDYCLEVKFGIPETLEPGFQISFNKFENRPFQQWVFLPVNDCCYRIMNKHNGLFLQSFKDSITGKDFLGQATFENSDSQVWKMEIINQNFKRESIFHLNSALSEALRVFDFTHQFHFFLYNSLLPLKATTVINKKEGKCIDEANYSVLLCRYLGIPSAVDFTPHWGNRSQSHSWSVIINPDNTGTPFYMGNVPGDTINFFHPYKKPKVFRKRYSVNWDIYKSVRKEKEFPNLFQIPTFTDVTNEYCQTSDITLTIPDTFNNEKKIAYICVFDEMNWTPVHYGEIKKRIVKFNSMGRGILYVAGFYENGEIKPFTNPFVLTPKGDIKDIKLNKSEKIDIVIYRKHPFWGEQDLFNLRMNNGCFQGANFNDFKDAITLYTHKGMTNGNWYCIDINNKHKFRYLRYIGDKGSYCNINELEFLDCNNQLIKGKIIGTEGESWAKKENVFDHNILTGFCANSPDGNWVGLELKHPQSISRIRYIGRNDGNCIEQGDLYEFYIYSNNKWNLFKSLTAKGDSLLIKNVPSGGLYLLRDRSKGQEERIFTYENGKQVWW